MRPEDYPGRGELPDKLAFAKPTRSRAYIALERADEPLTAAELEAELGCSNATAYRCLSDLQELGLVTEAVRLKKDYPPKTAYTTAMIETETTCLDLAQTDGGKTR